ncbi:Lipid A export ATP-binding/permease protein MsbA [Candidatus Arcanobacter lacustris]|uniref:Lipid A export ATP-binding/permease protein MsbA n=1 Tax=Candidatus Arcanibacter lacustris TaxID=1607817 RepID=A0A0F5MQ13_9RICK|nr:Lipid A export ATP-binding/permease protein MsbA [Candidatus Arcanobacter lacustris]
MSKTNINDSLELLTRIVKDHVSPYLKKLYLSVLCMIIVAITSAAHIALIKPALDDVFLKKNHQMLILLPLVVIMIALIKAASSYYQNYLMRYIGQRVITDMQVKLYSHLLYSDLSLIISQSSGKIISRFTNDITIMRGAVSNLITGMVKESLTVIFLVALMFYQDFYLTIIAFTVFPLAVIPIINTGRKMRKISRNTQEELGNYTSRLDDSFQSIRIIKSYNKEEYEIKKAGTITENIFSLYLKAIKTDAISSPIMEMLSGIGIALVIWYGGSKVMAGETTPGSFFAFIAAFITAYKPVKSLSSLNNNLQEGLAAAKRVFAILDSKSEINDKENAINLSLSSAGIKFDQVSFAYNEGKKALENITLEIPAGKTAALVGASGGGKSTIINLLLRFYDVASGAILINDIDIRDVTLKSLRENIAIVTQDITLFDDTIYANIAYGKESATMDEVIKAAKDSSAHEFISELEDGYNTIIGQNGMRLSGGQRQRISIARAMLKNSPILLLDEATSALDSISEAQVQKSLELLRAQRTTLVIAHRLSTIISADIIYVIKKGNVIESGTHNELIKNSKEYSKLYNTGFKS